MSSTRSSNATSMCFNTILRTWHANKRVKKRKMILLFSDQRRVFYYQMPRCTVWPKCIFFMMIIQRIIEKKSTKIFISIFYSFTRFSIICLECNQVWSHMFISTPRTNGSRIGQKYRKKKEFWFIIMFFYRNIFQGCKTVNVLFLIRFIWNKCLNKCFKNLKIFNVC